MHRILCLISIFLILPASLHAKTKDTIYQIDASAVPVVNVTIKGEKLRFLVDLSLPNILILNPDTAQKLGLKKSGFASMFDPTALVDGKKFKARSAKVQIEIEGQKKSKTRLYWFEVPYWRGVDGVMGPSGLNADIIEFKLDQSAASPESHSSHVIKLKSPTNWEIKTPLQEGKIGIFSSIKLHYAKTRSNIEGTRLLEHLNLTSVKSSYEPVEREFAIGASAANYQLKHPLTIFERPVSSLLGQVSLKTAESRNQGIEEIVARAKSKKKKKGVSPEIFLGKDAFSNCSKIIFSRKTKSLEFICH